MGNILQAIVTIKGTRPILWHRFGPESIPLEKGERTGVAGNDPEEWKKTYLATPEGQLYVEATYIFGTIRDGAKHQQVKRGTLQPFVAATLQIMDDRILFDRFLPADRDSLTTDLNAPVYLDIRSVKNPATRARNVRYRVAAASGWCTSFTLMWDAAVVNRVQMERAIIDAGRLVGLGDGRAVGFGRFELVGFEISEPS